MSARIALFSALAAIGCGSAHEPLPLLTTHGSSLVLQKPRLVSITYADYEYRQQVDAFGDFIVGSNWLETVVGEYGVQKGSHVAAHIDGPAPAVTSDFDEEKALQAWIESGQVPAPDAQTLYMIYVSSRTTASDHEGDRSCTSEGGYHSVAQLAAQTAFIYAVVYDCSGLDDVTAAASHELIEAAIDPDLDSYYLTYDPKLPVSQENADLCENLPAIDEGGFKVVRAWSNAAARAGHEPCVPAPPGDIYYNISVSPPDVQDVKPGETVTFELTGWSDAKVDPWVIIPLPGHLSALDLSVSLDTNRIGNGGHATLKVTVPPDAKPGAGYVDIYSGPLWQRFNFAGVRVPGFQVTDLVPGKR